ncbi:hypothetical protein A2U01_0001353, partial [Trifolium medium]|nr:hypothetical protein [Trifolium medium]
SCRRRQPTRVVVPHRQSTRVVVASMNICVAVMSSSTTPLMKLVSSKLNRH